MDSIAAEQPTLVPRHVQAWSQVAGGRDRPDVLTKVVDTAGTAWAEVVKHKVHANASREQLLRYRRRGTDLPGLLDVQDDQFKLVFLKTGLLTRAERHAMTHQGWSVLDRAALQEILTPAATASPNAIFGDFSAHLRETGAQCTRIDVRLQSPHRAKKLPVPTRQQ